MSPIQKFLLSILFCAILPPSLAQNDPPASPCPRLFSYESRKERDRWFGVVTLISESDLSGVWLRLIFDKPSLQLGNWFGTIKTSDNKEYLITNREHQLKANMPYALRFYIKYDPNDLPPPALMTIKLNARIVCPEMESSTPAAITGAAYESPTTEALPPRPSFSHNSPTNSGGGGGGNDFGDAGFGEPFGSFGSSSDDEDEGYVGDFQLLNRPNRRRPSRPPLNNEIECGTVAAQPRPLITYGQGTREGEFPWHAAIYHERGADLQYICGGSLVSHTHVITAGHCVTKKRSAAAVDPDTVVVYLGKHYLKKWSNTGIQDSQVIKIIPHPQYNSQTYANDIAVLKLVQLVTYSDYVRPICLWPSAESELGPLVNKPGTLVGWGFDHTGKVSEQLMQAKMPIVSKETCIYSNPDFFGRFTTSKTYCAGFRNGTSACNGDSGGGMVFARQSSSHPNRQQWHLRGLVSISVALQNQFRCDSAHYVVFTDVAKYLDWIKAAINE